MQQLTGSVTPPSLAIKLLNITLPIKLRAALIGDLVEEYATVQLRQSGKSRADLWFWKQTLLASYEFINKQKGEVMAFLVSVFGFTAVVIMAMWLGGEVSTFVNIPSVLIVFPPALLFGIGATSVSSLKLCFKLSISEQGDLQLAELRSAKRFAKVTGDSAVLMGIIGVVIGAISMATNIEPGNFSTVVGPATAVCLLTLLYGLLFKMVLYVIEQKIDNHFLQGA